MSTNVWAPVPDSLEEVQAQEPVRELHIDGVAVLKIVKHCHDNLPSMVAGSLLGLDVDGVLEVTYSYPFPIAKAEGDEDKKDDSDGQESQIDVMSMLKDVNIDNNCVGWYQSTYMGTYSTSEVVDYQYNYQSSEHLSDNSVVILYDPFQSRKGHLNLRAFRLSDEYMELRRSKGSGFLEPSNILVEIPVKIKNSGLISGYLRCLQDSHADAINCDFDALALSGGESFMEKNLEVLSSWTDDLLLEEQKFQAYGKANVKQRQDQMRWLHERYMENEERRENGDPLLPTSLREVKPLPEVPAKMEASLVMGQLDVYTSQVEAHVEGTFDKLSGTSLLYSSS